MFNIEFYETEDGKKPVEEFLDSLDSKMNAKMVALMELLEEKGNALRKPYSGPLGDGIFEIRCKFGSSITRVLYFFYSGEKIIITNDEIDYSTSNVRHIKLKDFLMTGLE